MEMIILNKHKLHLTIKYNLETNEFETRTNLTQEGVSELVDTVIRLHMGSGEDHSEPNEKDIYTISMSIDLRNDDIRISSDTGNKGLTTGIIMKYLQQLPED